ncbi:unnamed protein product [Protopolystoma xenopodis]|uniref:Uncharacterized protein n=1 Tax=Protopolystoma xenopodis TaxID=117903 RepID=A0A448X9Z9_9PLAT|nr:unnamed protein product [Protopolystoma xenopodis]
MQIVNFRIRSPLLYERLLGHPVRREILAGHSRTGHHAGISDSVEGLQPRSPTRMDGSAFTASRQLYSDEDEEIMLAEDKKYRTETARSIAATWVNWP